MKISHTKNRTFHQSVYRFMAAFFFLSTVFVACKKEAPVKPSPQTGKELEEISILKKDNPGFSSDAYVYIRNGNAYITLPDEADLSQVNLTFKISKGATLTLNAKPVGNLSGKFDLSKTIKAVVRSETGSEKSFTILAQHGISDFDRLLYEFKEKYNIPGVSYAILKMSNSQIVYKTGLGFSDKENLVRTIPSHLFRLGSISKQFTSLCIMKLIEEGKIDVESRVFGPAGILKDKYAQVSPLAAKVTVRNLLDHTSGWESNPDPMFTSSFSGQSLDQLIQYVLTSAQSEPGTKFSYYNMGFGILGAVIEQVTGKKYETFLKEVLAQAGITDVHVGGDRNGKRTNEAVYYSQDGYNGYLNNMNVIAAAGGVIASTEQMLKLITYIDGKDNPRDIINADTRNLMLTASHGNNYALGWRMNHRLFPNSWYHGGNLAGTATFWVMGPDYSTVILCNGRSYKSGFDDDFYYISEKLINISKNKF